MLALCEKYRELIERMAFNIARNHDLPSHAEDMEQEAYLALCVEHTRGTIGAYAPPQITVILRRAMTRYIKEWKSDGVTFNDEQLYE